MAVVLGRSTDSISGVEYEQTGSLIACFNSARLEGLQGFQVSCQQAVKSFELAFGEPSGEPVQVRDVFGHRFIDDPEASLGQCDLEPAPVLWIADAVD